MKNKLKVVEYIIISLILLVCISIGIYFNSKNTKEKFIDNSLLALNNITIQNQKIITEKLNQLNNNAIQLYKTLSNSNLLDLSQIEKILQLEDSNAIIQLRFKDKTIQKDSNGINIFQLQPQDNINIGIKNNNQIINIIQKEITQIDAKLYYYYDLKEFINNINNFNMNCYIIDSNGDNILEFNNNSAYLFNNIYDLIDNNKENIQILKNNISSNKNGILSFNLKTNQYIIYQPLSINNLYFITIVPSNDIEKSYADFFNMTTRLYLFFISLIVILCIFIVITYYKYDKKINRILYADYEKFKIEYKRCNDKKAIIMMDMDNFKLLSRLYGYENSNKVLLEISRILEKELKNSGFFARIADDRYIICITYKNYKEIISKIMKIYKNIKNIKNYDFVINTVYGIYRCNNEEIEEAQNRAVFAWNNAKKNQQIYTFYEENETIEMIENKKLLDNLSKNIDNQKLEIYFQPKFEINTKKIIGAEALLRWRDETGKMISPSDFIPVAEQFGYITTIDTYVMKKTCKIISELKKQGYDTGVISINVSRKKLEEENFIKEYETILKSYGLTKKDIEFEITEGTVLSSDKVINKTIKHLVSKKYQVVIDDFGTGYSSISMLKNIKVKGIKIDRSFVIDESETGKEILKYVISLAKKLNLQTIAEGIEEDTQYKYLKSLHCYGGQGFYFSKPLSLDDYKETIEKIK